MISSHFTAIDTLQKLFKVLLTQNYVIKQIKNVDTIVTCLCEGHTTIFTFVFSKQNKNQVIKKNRNLKKG